MTTTGTTAIDQIMDLIYQHTAPKAAALGLTDDQHADWMALVFDRTIRDTAHTDPDLAERILAAVTTDLPA